MHTITPRPDRLYDGVLAPLGYKRRRTSVDNGYDMGRVRTGILVLAADGTPATFAIGGKAVTRRLTA